jgi:2-amino-4-hydroxy-6-hydroxymethyldihydropteridine diphosphokinase
VSGKAISSRKKSAYIGLGSNIEPRKEYLDTAIKMLSESEGIELTAVSSYINTEPFGYTDQADFMNAVVEISTDLTPEELLSLCNRIESSLKRKRDIRWGPRTIDLDIILYGDYIIDEKNLIIPHSHMCYREFVLEPLNEIAPDVVHPVFKKTISHLYMDFLKGHFVKEVAAAVIRRDNKILICQRAAEDECGRLWEFPGGKRELGETLEECIVREIREELELDIKVTDVFARSIYHFNNQDVYFTVFNAEIINGELELKVHDAAVWITANEIKKYQFMPADIEFVEKIYETVHSD